MSREIPERDVQALARQIAELGASEPTRVYHMSWLSERLLEWAMANPDFKTRLFRFVDVFPACRADADVTQHLAEYFAGADVPRVLALALGLARRAPLGPQFSAFTARRNITRMARQFVAGATPADALPALHRLWCAGEASTVDVLGERTLSVEDANRYATRVIRLIETVGAAAPGWPANPVLERDPWGELPRVHVSVKPSALAPRFAPLTWEDGRIEATGRLVQIIERVRSVPATICLDMENDETKDLTLEVVRMLGANFRDGPPLGVVIQAYRRDAYDDLRWLVGWAGRTLAIPLQVRLVKGAYWDVESAHARAEGWPVPVYDQKDETDANYERCARYLVEHAGVVRPAFGSHNLRSLAYAIVAARVYGLPDSAIELQLLYGMAEPVHAALRRRGHRVRVYAPVGDLVPGMAYLVRRLLENTSNESFIRHRFAEGQEIERLIAPPSVAERDLPPPATEPLPIEPTDPASPGPFANEPHAELRRPAVRARLREAVASGVYHLGFDAPALIAGARVTTPETIVSVNPGDIRAVVCRSARTGAAEATRAIETAAEAFAAWRATPWHARAGILFRAAAIMRERRAELTTLEVFEAGKPPAEADADVCEAIDFCEYYGRLALALAAGAPIVQAPGEMNGYTYEPRGVGAVIAPWNFPLAIPTGMVAAALVTGNCVVFKPAEQTPGIGLRLVEILLAAGVPPGVLAFLPGVGEEVGAALVDHPRTAFVAFTGSKAVGLSIIERAARHHESQRHVKRVIAEMGGKNAIVIDADADLDQAVPAIVTSAFGYAGQKCSAASRVICVGAVHDELLDRLVGATQLVAVGPAHELGTVVGPLIDEEASARVERYRGIAREEGEVVLARDDVPDRGWYVGPTIALTKNPSARIATDEIFGPFVTILRAGDFDEALALANQSAYALTGGFFSRLPGHIRRAAEQFRAGNLYINRAITGARVGRQPFGGYGLSGVGTKAGGPDYLLQFLDPRVVTENTIRQGVVPSGG